MCARKKKDGKKIFRIATATEDEQKYWKRTKLCVRREKKKTGRKKNSHEFYVNEIFKEE